MPMPSNVLKDPGLLEAALEGLLLQKDRLEAQIREVRSLLGRRGRSGAAASTSSETQSGSPRKRELSEAARKRIAAAQKKRWAEYRRQQKAEQG
jgi:hypothetical protein